jgi:DNA-directed RNA polymerase sigma subunit (sigma70/sigma32)
VGKKKVNNQNILKERVLNVPLNDRRTYQSLANHLKVSKHMVQRLQKEGLLKLYTSEVKPHLTEESKQTRLTFAWRR